MKDAWTEYKEFLEDLEDSDDLDLGGDDEDDANDEWGELEKAMGGDRLLHEERVRAEAVSFVHHFRADQKAKKVLDLYHILHSSIPRFLPILETTPKTSYRPLFDASYVLVAAFDTAISAMYSDQDTREIFHSMTNLGDRSNDMVRVIRDCLSSIADPGVVTCRSFLEKWESRLASEIQPCTPKSTELSV